MSKRLLILGHTGKMGLALSRALAKDYSIVGKNSRDFDAGDFAQVRGIIEQDKWDIVVNAVALLGIDQCEQQPQKALLLNTLYPRFLAELSKEKDFLLVHFSTDAVFNDSKGDFYLEGDTPCPLNIYGLTKYGGDCFIQAICRRYYIFRIPLLFGETTKSNQFVEKMLNKVRQGAGLIRVSSDIVTSPTYSLDVAWEIKRIIDRELPWGLYHLANAGKASLYELMVEIISGLGLEVKVEKASYHDFAYIGIKNTFTPLASEKIDVLRPWKEAVKDYCAQIKFGL